MEWVPNFLVRFYDFVIVMVLTFSLSANTPAMLVVHCRLFTYTGIRQFEGEID